MEERSLKEIININDQNINEKSPLKNPSSVVLDQLKRSVEK